VLTSWSGGGDGVSDVHWFGKPSAGRLWLCPDLGDGRFGSRTEIGTGEWNGYHHLS
jgi:hypothetical protein